MNDWKDERTHTIRTRQDLPVSFSLSSEENAYFDRAEAHSFAEESSDEPTDSEVAGEGSGGDGAAADGETSADGTAVDTRAAGLGFAVTPYYLSLIGADPKDPLRLQCIPRSEELRVKEYEVQDPLSENRFSPLPRMVHRYPDRVLVLVTDECALYCRHCFRRYFASQRAGVISDSQIRQIGEYVSEHPQVHEIILSGGDPLTLTDDRLKRILRTLRETVRHISPQRTVVIRLASRIPAVLPQRVTPGLATLLAKFSPLYVITQFNHPREITAESRCSVLELVKHGLPVLNQAVLLKGVNDSAEVLADLFQQLLDIRVKPYYLFQGDLAAGTAHFRVPLSTGFQLMRELRQRISGLAMPVYAVDLPGGGGKIPLTENYLQGEENGWYRFTGPDGRTYYYPDETYSG